MLRPYDFAQRWTIKLSFQYGLAPRYPGYAFTCMDNARFGIRFCDFGWEAMFYLNRPFPRLLEATAILPAVMARCHVVPCHYRRVASGYHPPILSNVWEEQLYLHESAGYFWREPSGVAEPSIENDFAWIVLGSKLSAACNHLLLGMSYPSFTAPVALSAWG